MAVYLIDFENVTSAGISGIQRLTKEDKVYIFYTVNAANMSFAAHMNLLSSPAEVIYYNVTSGGKNALDFQLASFLGYLISKGESNEYYIISNDKGYEHVKNFWERSGLAAGVTIHGSPSINRSLIPLEKPFASKIQQTSPQPASVTLEQKKAESEAYGVKNSVTAEVVEENAKEKSADAEKTISDNVEKPAPKRRGRPKKQTAEAVAEKSEKTVKNPANSAKTASNDAKSNTANKKTTAKNKEVQDTLKQALKPLLAKAGIDSDTEISGISDNFKSADGKQQFYRNLIALYGMERGVEIYRVIRTEYTNLTKLVK